MPWTQLDDARRILGFERTCSEIRSNEPKRVSYRMPEHPRLEIIHLTDLHVGSRFFDRARFERCRQWILDEPFRYVLLGGDIIDAATVLSVGSPYDDVDEPLKQVRMAAELLAPLKGRILGYVGGNHERRTRPTYGDSGVEIAARLDVPYSSGVQLIDLFYGRHRPCRISLWHGAGSARTKGGKANVIERIMVQHDSQVFMVGHLHESMVITRSRLVRSGKSIRRETIIGIMSSPFTEWWNSYAEQAGIPAPDSMLSLVSLLPDGSVEVTLR